MLLSCIFQKSTHSLCKGMCSIFNKKFGEEIKDTVSDFKFARYFDSTKVVELQPVGSNVDNLPFLISQHNILLLTT